MRCHCSRGREACKQEVRLVVLETAGRVYLQGVFGARHGGSTSNLGPRAVGALRGGGFFTTPWCSETITPISKCAQFDTRVFAVGPPVLGAVILQP